MGQWLGSMLQVDLKLSPYLSSMRDILSFATGTWPMMTRFWPPLGGWIRSHYFQLRESVEPHVDFELVGAIGEFCSIPNEVKRWQACTLEVRMFDPAAPRQAQNRRKQVEIEDRIRAKLAAAGRIAIWVQQHDLPAHSLLRTAFDAWKEPDFTFEPASLDRLAEAVKQATYAIPQLLIGAVDIDSGAFVAFSSERAPDDTGITLDAVVASASLPWVVPAQAIEGIDPETHEKRRMSCWDGLFSQNPPIKNFISEETDRKKKPDGLWIEVVRIVMDSEAVRDAVGRTWGCFPSSTAIRSSNSPCWRMDASRRRTTWRCAAMGTGCGTSLPMRSRP
jgi:hypothetical protein